METSETVFECLDKLGYSLKMIQYRRDKNKIMDEIYNSKAFAFRNLTIGAKAQGTALYYESDIDRLYEAKCVTCVQPGTPCSSPTVFHLDRTDCSPGLYKAETFHHVQVFSHGDRKISNDGKWCRLHAK